MKGLHHDSGELRRDSTYTQYGRNNQEGQKGNGNDQITQEPKKITTNT